MNPASHSLESAADVAVPRAESTAVSTCAGSSMLGVGPQAVTPLADVPGPPSGAVERCVEERTPFERRGFEGRLVDRRFVDRRLLGPVAFAAMQREAAIREVRGAVEKREARVFAFCNMHTFNLARRLPALAGALSRATVFNDGVGMELASRLIHGKPFPANLNGTDLTPAILGAFTSPVRVCLVGSRHDVVARAATVLEERYPSIRVIDVHDGFFDLTESERLIDRLARLEPDLVLVGMGNPRQELWAINAATRVTATFLCIGAFLDFISGNVRRAPGLVRRLRGEWLYRLALEPRRLSGRYLIGGPRFMVDVFRTWHAGRSSVRDTGGRGAARPPVSSGLTIGRRSRR